MKHLFLFLFFLSFIFSLSAQSEWQFRFMPQIAFGTKNTVQRPNDEGTRISLNKDFNRKNAASFSPRIELEYNFKRHHAIATIALLRDRFEGVLGEDILYNGISFNSGNKIDAVYRFNTYRLSYRYRIVENSMFFFELGATLLLRDAFISFENDSHKTTFKNVGVAPLLSYFIEWKTTDRISLTSYGDAFAVKAGRAEDIFVGAKYRFTAWTSAIVGYRLLEGGSDSDRIYTMSTFHFISIGIGFNL